jgi:heme-degrading monooxygenase HmoA
MSVLMTLQTKADATKLEHESRALMQGLMAKAKQHGVISHHFYGTKDEVLVVDEWPDEESFRRFFEASPEIAGMWERAGASGEPDIRIWRHLETSDDVG